MNIKKVVKIQLLWNSPQKGKKPFQTREFVKMHARNLGILLSLIFVTTIPLAQSCIPAETMRWIVQDRIDHFNQPLNITEPVRLHEKDIDNFLNGSAISESSSSQSSKIPKGTPNGLRNESGFRQAANDTMPISTTTTTASTALATDSTTSAPNVTTPKTTTFKPNTLDDP